MLSEREDPLTSELPERTALERIGRLVDPRGDLVRAWPLQGGTSARLTALEVRLPDGETRRLVVRQHGEADRAADPRVAANEFTVLRVAGTAGIPVPEPLYLDESCEVLPTPYLVIDYVEGESRPAAADAGDVSRQLATALAAIHRLDPADVSFLRRQEERVAERLREQRVGDERVWATLAPAWPLKPRNRAVLLHGDFWPGNALWREGTLVAVVDWEDAKIGDPLADLANGRLEVLWAFGSEAMDDFTRHYQDAMPSLDGTDLPYWDLAADLRLTPRLDEWGLDTKTGNTFREQRESFVASALDRLGRRPAADGAAAEEEAH
jgi:aminoglycoside phosphotransferase (APT) family kinase protein